MNVSTGAPRWLAVPLLAALATSAPLTVHAQAAPHYQIQAGSLSQALNRFAAEAGISLQFSSALTHGLESPGLNGSYTPEQGLALLLASSSLVAVSQGNGVYVLEAVPSEGVMQLGATTVGGWLGATSEGSRSYAARAATIGKGEHALKDIPQSVTVMTRQRMDDQNLTTLDSVLTQATGVTREFRNYGHSVYYARGFAIDNYMVDGVPMGYYGGIGIAPDTAIFDRVEILRGAPGLLVGNGDPGGTVNLARKRPLGTPQLQITARAGSWDYYRTDIDVTGPLNDSATLRGRAVAAYEDRHYFYDNAQSRLPLFYGILEADLSEDTLVSLGGRYQRYHQEGGRWAGGLPQAIDGSDLHLSRSTSLGPSWTYFDAEVKEVFADVTHALNERWKLKLSGTYQESNRQDGAMMKRGTVNPQTLSGLTIHGMDYESSRYVRKGLDGQLSGTFDGWGQTHELFLGANWQKESMPEYLSTSTLYSPAIVTDPRSIDTSSLPHLYRGTWGDPYKSEEITQGLYGNTRLKLLDPLTLILGGRLSWYEYEDKTAGVVGSSYKQTREATPFAALIYELNDQWSLYASYADIFKPQSSARTSSGSPLEPAIGSNYELGIKGELYDGRLNGSLAIFRIDQDNLAQTDPEFPNACPGVPGSTGGCSINAGKVRSQGFEAEVNGELMTDWQLAVGYTYNETEYLRDRTATGAPSANEGRSLSGSHNPRHLLRAWTTYRLPGALHDFSVGAGVDSQSEVAYRSGANHYSQSGRSVWSARGEYVIDENWTAAVNLNNVFDKKYYTGAGKSFYGEPRNLMLTLRGTY